jgi:tetratricopeptide (TPR) repeat protein
MSLSNKNKNYVRKYLAAKTAKEIATDLKVDLKDVENFISKEKKIEPEPKLNQQKLSTQKKVLFTFLTLLIPVIFFVTFELILQSTNYRGNTDLFIQLPALDGKYKVANSNFASRYFFYTTVVPNPPAEPFLAQKPENGFRVFVMGESSAAGYPYGYNGIFGRVTQDALQDILPDHHVEVITVATSAINSYTLYDQVDEILAEKPDAIIIYTGHNEFYGALGVGSNENLGSFPGFVRFYLRIQRYKTFLFLRDQMVSFTKWIGSALSSQSERTGETLMQQVVRDQSIALDSPVYKMGLRQFKSNMTHILDKFAAADVPVFLGSLASNLKDHYPFESVETDLHPPANAVYEEAQKIYLDGDLDEALKMFTYARDLDALKFRASTAFNFMIQSLSNQPGVYYVPVEERLRDVSDNGIIGYDLMLEHLHPNSRGYFEIGMAYFEAIKEHGLTDKKMDLSRLDSYEGYYKRMALTELDHNVVEHRLRILTGSWPFVRDGSTFNFRNYRFKGIVDSLAYEVVSNRMRWDQAKVTLGEHYIRVGEPEKMLAEFKGLMRDQPYNDSPFLISAQMYLDRGRLSEAKPYLQHAHGLETSAFTYKMLGAIEINEGNFAEGIVLIEESLKINPRDTQALFNLSGAHAQLGDLQKGLEIVNELIAINPNFPGAQSWKNQLETLIRTRRTTN